MPCAKCPRAWRPPSPAATMRPRPRTITPRIADRRAPLQEAAVAAFLHGGSHLRHARRIDRKSTRLNSSHLVISYAVFCLKKKNTKMMTNRNFHAEQTSVL